MGMEEIERVKSIFQELNLNPEYREHAPAITSEEASRNRGDLLKQGIKSLLFTNGKDFIIVNLPADQKVDTKKVEQTLNWQRSTMRMATPQEVIEKTGCEIGAVPPFGHKTPLQILVDLGVYDNKESAFNIGLRTYSVKISTHKMKNLFRHLNALEGAFAKSSQKRCATSD
ncbi:hypothetical protein FJZ18_01400 [Candidatus Pacearchaeota archaeon]|nr:hypothetical protein [Candidatus Pacearchaeota archaeon]